MINLDLEAGQEPIVTQVSLCKLCGRTHWMKFERLFWTVVNQGRTFEYIGRCGRQYCLVSQEALNESR